MDYTDRYWEFSDKYFCVQLILERSKWKNVRNQQYESRNSGERRKRKSVRDPCYQKSKTPEES